jgi:hypothetical protein
MSETQYKTIKFKFGKFDATTIGDFIDYATTTLKGAGLTLCFSEVDTNSSESKQEHSAAFSAVYTSLEKQEALQDVFKASSTIRAQGQTPKWGDNVVDVTKGIEALMAMFTTDEPAELACDLLKEIGQYKPNREEAHSINIAVFNSKGMTLEKQLQRMIPQLSSASEGSSKEGDSPSAKATRGSSAPQPATHSNCARMKTY